jgi:hypothetical protein
VTHKPGTAVMFTWKGNQRCGTVDQHRGAWVMIRSDDAERGTLGPGVVAVRESQVKTRQLSEGR